MNICPICNGLLDYERSCHKCGNKMEVQGRLEDYEDGYSPYLNYSITDLNDGDSSNICSHLLICPYCKNTEVVEFRNVAK